MRKSKTYFALALSFIFCCRLQAQHIDSALNILSRKFPSEKLYIHYDKDYYLAGETIWFKAYFLSDGLPSAASSNFNLQLVDSKGKLVLAKQYPVIGATAKGQIELSDSLPQGNYYVQASTQGMLVYGANFVYEKNLFVFHPGQESKTQSSSPAINVRFFPESGHLIDGLLTVVGFKATDASGNPVDISGVIRSEDGSAITSFKSLHDGMGKTQFRVQGGKKYKATIDYNGATSEFPLPDVELKGINLRVQDEQRGKMFTLARNEKLKSDFGTVTIVADINNHVVYETEINLDDDASVRGHLITDSLPSGILHFTVFDKVGFPLAERLSFVYNREYVSVAGIRDTKADFKTKAANTFDIDFSEAVQRSLSVAVTDAAWMSAGGQENSWTSFILTGDLKGTIFNPAYYFNNNADSTLTALDNLMLTQGWSRYDWNKILANDFPSGKYEQGRFLSISGIVNDETDKAIMNGGKLNITIESEDSTSQNYEVKIGADGRFTIDSAVVYGKSELYYVYTSAGNKQKKVKVHLDPSKPYPVLTKFPETWQTTLPSNSNIRSHYQWIKNDRKAVTGDTVVVYADSRKPLDIVNDQYTTGAFKAQAKATIDNINTPVNDKAMSGFNYIKNRIQQIEVSGRNFVGRKTLSLGSGQKWPVGIYIDEIPSEITQLNVLRADEIALVKYFEPGFVGAGTGSPGGVLAVYTKKKQEEKKNESLDHVPLVGYSLVKTFYQADYTTPAKLAQRDERTTLYWNPDLYTDSETKTVNIKFFNNDTSKKFRVVVEGFDVKGKLVHVEKIIGE